MRLRIERNLGQGWPKWQEGEEVDADQKTADALLRSRLATVIEQPPVMQAVPAPVELAAVPPQIEKPKSRKRGDE